MKNSCRWKECTNIWQKTSWRDEVGTFGMGNLVKCKQKGPDKINFKKS